MTYTTGIPASGQSLGSSRVPIVNNFFSLKTTIDQDHVDMNNTGPGKHKQSTYPESAAGPTTAVNEGAVYTKVAAGITALFWRGESNATEVQMTTGSPNSTSNGSTFLPGGIIIKWGSYSLINGQATAPQTFITTFPNNVWSIVITPASNNPNNFASYDTQTLAGFTAYRGNTTGVSFFTYIAIGN